MKLEDVKKFDLPDAPGVYYFVGPKLKAQDSGRILYIGKATSLKDRVKSYFSKDITLTRGPKIEKMLLEAERVEYSQTDSVLEALILEANEIKKHQPPANSRDKDNKSYNYVVITKEEFPRILLERGRNLESKLEARSYQLKVVFGPFPHGGELREALKIIRRIFPYRDAKCKILPEGKRRPCFNAQIGLCPGPCADWVSKAEYAKTIRHLKLFFEGKKPRLISSLEKEMKALAKAEKFEEAEKVKRQIFALEHIQDIALIKNDLGSDREIGFRIEAYDIAHTSGKEVVGVMTVVEDGELNKSQYRKFKIKADANDDVNNLKEVLNRRLNHPEWPMPNLIVVDGGIGQLNAARDVLTERGFDIPAVSVVKDEKHRARGIMDGKGRTLSTDSQGPTLEYKREILLANAEAHRFAIGYHRKLRGKGFRL